jgi:bifunctional non-homologous end joining protein LigD
MKQTADTKLSRYHEKRDFQKTPEPYGEDQLKPGQQLVIQQHFARRTHFDLRLEIGGVLVSWAVTRGPSANPHDKRLAVRTEDHPLSYGSFEGLIPKPQYGGGTVILWEFGSYKTLNGTAAEGLASGHIKFEALGQRMKGAWALVRMKGEEKRENWLLIKERDEFAETDDSITARFDTGVLSGLSRADIEGGKKTTTRKTVISQSSIPVFVAPQLCGSQETVPVGEDWAFEMKYDGYRLLIAVGGGEAIVYTRSGLDWSARFPQLQTAASALPVKQCLLDGEAVVFDKHGISDFPALVAALESKHTSAITYVAFDILQLDEEDLKLLPYTERKKRLRAIVPLSEETIRYGEYSEGNGDDVFEAATKAGAEGIIAKLKSAPYRSGRSDEWLKIKGDVRDDVLIIGYMLSDKHAGFASLLAAKEIHGQLSYVGRIGGGYNADNRPSIEKYFQPQAKRPINISNPDKIPKGAKFISKPFGAEVRFGGWTTEGQMRQARFLAIQNDRESAQQMTIEKTLSKPPVQSAGTWRITHPDRVLFPKDGITKGDIAAYYENIEALILPHLSQRPLSLLRAPENIESEMFFQRHPLRGMTDGVEEFGSKDEKYFALSGQAGLAAAVQFGTIEFHGWNATHPNLDHPDRMIFDLDPDPEISFEIVKSSAMLLRDYLFAAKLQSWPLLSGGKGIHIVVPLDRSNSEEDVENFCKQFAKRLEADKPKLFVANMAIAKRKGKIFVDYLRNRSKATAIIPWSVRARAGAPIAAPLSWELIAKAKAANDYNTKNLPPNNCWKEFWTTRQNIPVSVIKMLSEG